MNRIVLFLILAVSSALIAYGDTINGQYNANPPVLIDGQTAPVQLDANGSVKISVTGSSAAQTVGAIPYCLAGAPTVNAGYFVSTAATNITDSSITLTDGSSTYIAAVTSSSVGCFIKQ